MDRDGRRAEYAKGLHAEAERRFGAARAEALRQTIEDAAGWMAEVATFPAIRRQELSPLDLVEALLERVEAVDGRVQAWALVDRDGARAAARQAADEAVRGVLRGPLHGVPFGAKDIFYSAGLRTEAGSKVMTGFMPKYDATAVARLKDAGAILLGKLAAHRAPA